MRERFRTDRRRPHEDRVKRIDHRGLPPDIDPASKLAALEAK
jgi:hypothetical protein